MIFYDLLCAKFLQQIIFVYDFILAYYVLMISIINYVFIVYFI